MRVLLPLLFCTAALAGPPFQTDDPHPVDFRNWEAYLFSTFDNTRVGSMIQVPAFEMNYGAAPNLQLHIVIPMAAFLQPEIPGAYGIGDIEVGFKYRFVKESGSTPEIGIFPFAELPTGNAQLGLGNGRTWYRLPLWIQKTKGPWTTYGGAGEVINSAPGLQNYTFAGWMAQRDIGKRWTLGGEIFGHGAEGPLAVSTRASVLADFGGYYYIRKPGFQVLFLAGHSIAGQPETVAYLGLYWTWGKQDSGSTKGFFRQLARI